MAKQWLLFVATKNGYFLTCLISYFPGRLGIREQDPRRPIAARLITAICQIGALRRIVECECD